MIIVQLTVINEHVIRVSLALPAERVQRLYSSLQSRQQGRFHQELRRPGCQNNG